MVGVVVNHHVTNREFKPSGTLSETLSVRPLRRLIDVDFLKVASTSSTKILISVAE